MILELERTLDKLERLAPCVYQRASYPEDFPLRGELDADAVLGRGGSARTSSGSA